jgi:hypothetical protein
MDMGPTLKEAAKINMKLSPNPASPSLATTWYFKYMLHVRVLMFRKELPVSEAAEDISSSSGVALDYPLLGSLSAMDVLHHLISKGT